MSKFELSFNQEKSDWNTCTSGARVRIISEENEQCNLVVTASAPEDFDVEKLNAWILENQDEYPLSIEYNDGKVTLSLQLQDEIDAECASPFDLLKDTGCSFEFGMNSSFKDLFIAPTRLFDGFYFQLDGNISHEIVSGLFDLEDNDIIVNMLRLNGKMKIDLQESQMDVVKMKLLYPFQGAVYGLIGMEEDESLEMLVGSVSNSIEELKKVEDENYSVYNDAWTEMKKIASIDSIKLKVPRMHDNWEDNDVGNFTIEAGLKNCSNPLHSFSSPENGENKCEIFVNMEESDDVKLGYEFSFEQGSFDKTKLSLKFGKTENIDLDALREMFALMTDLGEVEVEDLGDMLLVKINPSFEQTSETIREMELGSQILMMAEHDKFEVGFAATLDELLENPNAISKGVFIKSFSTFGANLKKLLINCFNGSDIDLLSWEEDVGYFMDDETKNLASVILGALSFNFTGKMFLQYSGELEIEAFDLNEIREGLREAADENEATAKGLSEMLKLIAFREARIEFAEMSVLPSFSITMKATNFTNPFTPADLTKNME